MSFYYKYWDCPLEQVAEHQQENCAKHGMSCEQCMKQADEDGEDEQET